MNRSYQLESKLVFETARNIVELAIKTGKQEALSTTFNEKIESALDLGEKVSISLYDMFNKKLIATDQFKWLDKDNVAAEKSIFQKRKQSKNYVVMVDKVDKKLSAYIPFETDSASHLYVARVIYHLEAIEDALWNARGALLTMLIMILITGLFIGRGLAKSIVNPIRKLNEATESIMGGDLDKKVSVKTGDEIEALADAFNHMSDALKAMKTSAEDSNPLTNIPGNNGIKKDLQYRILNKQKFVLFHSDLDRFKIFNDHYGLAKGDDAIKMTADLIKDVIQKEGSEDDFVGHQGGDDFVVVVKPQKADHIASIIIKRFDDEVVRALYPKEDYDRGYTLALDRRSAAAEGDVTKAQQAKFPLLGLSLAGVSNKKKDFADWNDAMKAAVKIKKEVKDVVESSYMIKE